MADSEVPGMAPSLALSVPSRPCTYMGRLCCGKAQWILSRGIVVTACPDHEPTYDFAVIEPHV